MKYTKLYTKLYTKKYTKNYSYSFALSRNICLRPIIVTPIELYSESDNLVSWLTRISYFIKTER